MMTEETRAMFERVRWNLGMTPEHERPDVAEFLRGCGFVLEDGEWSRVPADDDVERLGRGQAGSPRLYIGGCDDAVE